MWFVRSGQILLNMDEEVRRYKLFSSIQLLKGIGERERICSSRNGHGVVEET